MFLCELGQPVARLAGVGPAKAADLGRLGVTNVAELLLHVPRDWEDRSTTVAFREAADGTPANTVATVVAHDYVGPVHRSTLKIYLKDETTVAALVCFGRNFLANKFPVGTHVRVYAPMQHRFGELQATAFDLEDPNAAHSWFGRVLPIYALAGRLTQTDVRKFTAAAVAGYGRDLSEELPEPLLARRDVLATRDALAAVHQPTTVEEARAGRDGIIYRELFFLQLGIAQRTVARRRQRRSAAALPSRFLEQLHSSLPFTPTGDQELAVQEIIDDLSSQVPMARLLQGDVGSGKTLVALLTAMPVIEAGYQVVLMAPTELLAQQHADNLAALIERAGLQVTVALLTGSVTGEARARLEEAVSTGAADLVVGTHAVFTERTQFRNLRYVIVDEQHRFGVQQRSALLRKSRLPDLLLMTATPIPRTLALTVFGDMSVTTITTMPPGRKPVRTHLAKMSNEMKVYEYVRREIESGRQAYFIYPLIDRSSSLELKDAETTFRRLSSEVFPDNTLGLLHSRIPEAEKREIMEHFRDGSIQILVATSVVEVGVDVANATCMVVEHAERFGLAALHQLRGRVGRGEHQSYCFLVYDESLTEEAKERLKVMLEESDGFRIAEEDLRIRGPGDIAGVQQAGYLRLRVADLARDMAVMNQARTDAFAILETDPMLEREENRRLAQSLTAAAAAGMESPFGRAMEAV